MTDSVEKTNDFARVNRRNLSGVYIFHQFDNEESKEPTCFEDCPLHRQDEWLNSLNEEALKNLAKHLAEVIRDIGDKFNIARA